MTSPDAPGPVVMRGVMTSADWPALAWSPGDWMEAVMEEVIRVRRGKREPGLDTPQWERSTEVMEVRTREYFDPEWRTENLEPGTWSYFDYQYMSQALRPDRLSLFSWGKFGLSTRDGADSTLWVGTLGAHTPCHQDSYGCNLVCQVAGSKQWTLFPPSASTHLSPTRVPYEESSVYSLVNMVHLEHNYQHLLDKLSKATAYRVTLNPGDVLHVPPQWWHQVVTTSEWSVSVNTWVAAPGDDVMRLEEALVRWQVATTLYCVTDTGLSGALLNPNEDELQNSSLDELSQLVDHTVKIAQNSENTKAESDKIKFDGDVEVLQATKIDIPKSTLNPDKFKDCIYHNAAVKILNSVTSGSVIKAAARELLNKES